MDEVSNGKKLQLASCEIIVGLAMGTRYFYIYIFTTQFCISKLVPLILSTVEYEEHQSTLPTEAQQH